MKYRACSKLTLLILGGAVLQAHAEPQPKWEIGAGVATLNLPDYRGADQRSTYLLPMPYVVYRGDLVRADREGIRGILFDSDRVNLNLSVNGTLPVSSSNNAARNGMESLRPTVEVGPTLDVSLWRSADQQSRLDFRLPLRGSVTVASTPRHIGWLMFPNLAFGMQSPFGLTGWNMGVVAGSYITDRRYNSYFYSVGEEHATAWRPAYRTSGGYGGSQLTWTMSKRFPRYWVGAFVRYDTLRGAVFEDSPLVRKRGDVAAGFAISWVFRTSRVQVEDPD